MNIERIEDLDGSLLAMILRDQSIKSVEDDVNFVTHPCDGIQVGFVRHAANHRIAPHKHAPALPIQPTCTEVIAVRSGRLQVFFYPVIATGPNYCQTRVLSPGDVMVHLAGGHGFLFLDDASLLEVKRGPYIGKDVDKGPI